MEQTETRTARSRAAIVAIAPALLLAGFISHPYIGLGPPDDAVIAAAVTADTTRWGLSHLTVAVGSGVLAVAFLAIHSYLREADESHRSVSGLPFIVIGSTLFAVLPGMEFAPLAAARTGADVQAVQAALFPWFAPVLAVGAFTFAYGLLGFARGITHSGVLSRPLTGFVVGALAVIAASRFVPLAVVQFYVQGAAGIVALWPLAFQMWAHPQPRPTGRQPRPLPATATGRMT